MNTSKSAPANRPGLAAILLVAGVLALPALAAEEQPPPAGTAPAPKGPPPSGSTSWWPRSRSTPIRFSCRS